MTAKITDADSKAAHALVDVWYLSKAAVFGDPDDTSLSGRVAQAIADAREEAFALCVEWVRDAEGDGVAADLVIAWRSR